MPVPRKHIFHDLAGKNRRARSPIVRADRREEERRVKGRGPSELEYPVICGGEG